MTASKTKYYFRKKTKSCDVRSLQANSSTDSEDFASNGEDVRRVTLHVITDPGQSEAIISAFQNLVRRLDLTCDVVCVSERFKPVKSKRSTSTLKGSAPTVPAIAIVLFFNDGSSSEKVKINDDSNNKVDSAGKNKLGIATKRSKNVAEVRNIFKGRPWRFHHKVAVSGKLISCDSNQQDYFEYNYHDAFSTPQTLNAGRRTPFVADAVNPQKVSAPEAAFPLWGVREVHCGKQILRFTIFVSQENWEDQISLYKLILRAEETKVRDDFCYFVTFANASVAIQIGMKRLPHSLKPLPLTSAILQFKVRNIGQLVPLLPYACEPISELRWRTRDHDSNLILLQIHRSLNLSAASSFVEKLFIDRDSSDSREKAGVRIRGNSPLVFLQNSHTNGRATPSGSRSSSHSKIRDAEKFNPIPSKIEKQAIAPTDSFVFPSLPEKMPLLKPTFINLPKHQSSRSSTSSATSSENCAALLSGSTSPERAINCTPAAISTPKLDSAWHPKTIRSGRVSVTIEKRTFTELDKTFKFSSSSQDNEYYV